MYLKSGKLIYLFRQIAIQSGPLRAAAQLMVSRFIRVNLCTPTSLPPEVALTFSGALSRRGLADHVAVVHKLASFHPPSPFPIPQPTMCLRSISLLQMYAVPLNRYPRIFLSSRFITLQILYKAPRGSIGLENMSSPAATSSLVRVCKGLVIWLFSFFEEMTAAFSLSLSPVRNSSIAKRIVV